MKKLTFIFLLFIAVSVLFYGCKKEEEGTGDPIQAELVLSPSEIFLNDFDTAVVFLSTNPEKQVSWQAIGPEWIDIEPSSGTLNGQILEVALYSRVNDMEMGNYFAMLEVISDGAGKATASIGLEVGANPVIEVSPGILDFPENIKSQTLNVKNTGSGYLNWELSPSESWLKIEPSQGMCESGETRVVTVTVDHENMAIGSYTASISVNSNSSLAIEAIPVDMAVPENALMSFSPDTVDFNFFLEEVVGYLKNTGNIDYDWELTIDEEYVDADIKSGSLSMGDSTKITFSINRDQLSSGNHTATVHLQNNKGIEAYLPVSANQYNEEKWLLDNKIIDAEFDRNNDVIIAVTDAPYQLLKLDPETETVASVALNLPPLCVSVHPDGTHATVGHDGKVTYVDLGAMSTIEEFNISEIPGDIVLAGNNYTYIFPQTGQWTDILCLNLDNGNTSQSTGYSIRHRTKAKLHPSGEYMYGANNGVSPSDFEKYDIRSGTAHLMYDSPYHGDYSFGGDIWISDDGLRLFARSRNVFNSSTNQNTDMTYNGQLSGENFLVTLDHSSAAKHIYAIEMDGDVWESYPSNEVRIYEADYLNYSGSWILPGFIVPNEDGGYEFHESEGHFGFFNSTGTKYFVLVKARAGSNLLHDWAVATLDVE